MIVPEIEAIKILNSGEVAAVPTETVYGLAGLIDHPEALQKIFKVKARPFFDPLIVHVADLDQAKTLFLNFSKPLHALAQKFWPGPLTLVAAKAPQVSDLITSSLPTVAVRSPRHPIALNILKATGPFAAPSANRFGKTSPTMASHVLEEFGGKVPVVDGGASEIGIESTVVEVTEEAFKILRPGQITEKDLKPIADQFGLKISEGLAAPNSPGQLKHHYQPDVPLVWVKANPDREKILSLLSKPSAKFVELKLSNEPAIAARLLYSELRELSRDPANIILFEPDRFPWSRVSKDLLDRLSKAATLKL